MDVTSIIMWVKKFIQDISYNTTVIIVAAPISFPWLIKTRKFQWLEKYSEQLQFVGYKEKSTSLKECSTKNF